MSEKPSYEELENRVQELERAEYERKRVEDELSKDIKEWQTTFNATNAAIWVLDKDHLILRTNRVAEKMFQLSEKEIVGKHCWEIVHGTKQPIPECPIFRAKDSLQRETMELQLNEKWYEITVDPILDTNGEYAKAVHIITNITERKQNENALHKSEERLSLATETAGLGIWEWRFDTGKLYDSRNKILEISGLTYEEAQNFSLDLWLSKVHPDDRKRTEEKLQAHFRAETECVENELRFRHPEKGWIWLYGIGRVVERDTNGKPIRLVGVHQDITERKRAEKEREKLIKKLQEALKEIKTLRGILPLCSFCKKIRDDKGYWEQVDVYIHKYSQADISHSICPECAKEHYPDLDIHED